MARKGRMEESRKELWEDERLKSNREYQSTVFTSYFSIPEHAARLFEKLEQKYGGERSRRIEPGDIVFQTLGGFLYMARKNDLAFTARKRILVIGEHQSTVNKNMPLRGAIYYGRTMEKMIPPRAIYKTKKMEIPTPEFYVFYNGKEQQPLEQILSLSDSFLEKTDAPMLELKVKVININLLSGHPILKECRPLYEYSWFMWKVREYLQAGKNRDEAISLAMEDSISQGIMKEYLKEHGSEVRNMLFTEFNLEEAREVWEEEAREEGRQEGADYKVVELTCKKLRKGKSPRRIADELEEEMDKIQVICQVAGEFAPDYDVMAIVKALKGGW